MRHTYHLFTGKPWSGTDAPADGPFIDEYLQDSGPPTAFDEACAAYMKHNIEIHRELVKPYPGLTSH
jgi:hypothetical protein